MTAPTCPREVLETARHEAGHVLAAWWIGIVPDAVEMRRHEEGRPRLTSRGAEISQDARAAVLGGCYLDGFSVKGGKPFGGWRPELGRRLVAADLLSTLAGPAVEWRNERDPEEVYPALAALLADEPTTCAGDLDNVDALLALLPEEERGEAYATACRRAEVLVCRHWPELCALAERLAAADRLEDEALLAAMAETLGDPLARRSLWDKRGRPEMLEALDPPRLALGAAEVVAWWERVEMTAREWRLAATVDRVPLAPGITLERLDADDLEALAWDAPDPAGWYWLESVSGADDMGAGAPPGGGPLRDYLAALVGDKLEELRRDPDSQRHGKSEPEPSQVGTVSKVETASRMESPQ